MPIFKSNHNDANHTTETRDRRTSSDNSPNRKGSLFSRRRSVSPAERSRQSNADRHGGGGFFGGSSRRRSSDDSSNTSSSRGGGSSFFGGNKTRDPTILAARQKVTDAEGAEKEADRALHAARMSVKEAREHCKILEREAEEDARRAKAKQVEAKGISKSAKGLGRHG